MKLPTLALVLLVSLPLCPVPAQAQDTTPPTTAFPVERLMGAPGGRGIVSLEDPRVEGQLSGFFYLLVSSGRRPLVLRLDQGSSHPAMLEPVTQATTFQLSAALELHRKARFSVTLPLQILAGDRLQGLGEDRDFPPMSAGDLRLGFTFNVWTGESLPFSLAAAGQISLPTGDDGNFGGVDQPGLVLRLLMGVHPFDWLRLLGHFGAYFHDKRDFYGSLWGQRLPWGVGFELGLPWIPVVGKRVAVFSEVDGEVCLDCSTRDPLELRGGVVGRVGRWQARVSAGGGLSDAATVPAWRVTGGVGVKIGEQETKNRKQK